MRKHLLAASVMLLLATAAQGQEHSGHAMAPAGNEATAAYEAASATMHEDMMVEYTGNPDVDFLKSMIPHHQGAIDMAKIVLQYGNDPEIKKLAEEIIKAQESEIAMMQEMLAKAGQ
jgi:uncharacterized protein (DUF305 family)